MANDPRQVYRLFFNPGEVTEIRALGLSGRSNAWSGFAKGDDAVVFGYFDNAEDFGKAAEALDTAQAGGIYFIPNLVDPESLSKASNHLVTASKKRPATSDQHIQVVRWLLIDFDPPTPMAGVSATDEEREVAMDAAKTIAAFLRDLGWADPIKASSGNGYHLNYRIEDTPCTDEYRKDPITKKCLQAISEKLSGHKVKFDLTVFNPSRIWKLYSTYARKGDSTKTRPHRQSRIFPDAPAEFSQVPVTPFALVEQLAEMAPVKEEGAGSRVQGSGKKNTTAGVPAKRGRPAERMNPPPAPDLGKLKVEEYLAAFGREVHSVDDQGVMTRFNLRECVFNSDHKARDAAVLQDSNGKLSYHCSHNSCRGKTFADARVVISGEEKLTKFMTGYDPNWKPPETCGSGVLEGIEIAPVHIEVGSSELPSPIDIDPMEFFTVRGNHGRPAFVVQAMANYLAAYLSPIVCTDGVFWRYTDGCWKRFHDDTIKQMIAQCLKDRVQADWIKGSLQVLAAIVNRLESQWVRRPFIINLKNGVIDLEQLVVAPGDEVDIGKLLKPHDPAYGCRAQLPVDYDPDAVCNKWIKTLWEMFPEGRECSESGKNCAGDDKLSLLQQFGGYLLLPTCKYERAAFLVGAGANGKSTVMNTFIQVIGKENTVEMSLDDLARSFNIPYLQDKLLVTCTEMTTREPSAVSVLKKCISGDMVSGEWKYKQRIDFYPTAKFAFALNEVPSIVDKSYGFVRKILILNFNQRFEKDRRDVDLVAKLQAERSGIFLWMLEGACELIRKKGFTETDTLEEDKMQFLQEMNPFLMWVSENCELGKEMKASAEALFENYRAWADKSGLQGLGKIKFYHSVLNYLPAVKKGRLPEEMGRKPGMLGIGLKAV
jgi:P4 family phage/plasmid primase-like protien